MLHNCLCVGSKNLCRLTPKGEIVCLPSKEIVRLCLVDGRTRMVKLLIPKGAYPRVEMGKEIICPRLGLCCVLKLTLRVACTI